MHALNTSIYSKQVNFSKLEVPKWPNLRSNTDLTSLERLKLAKMAKLRKYSVSLKAAVAELMAMTLFVYIGTGK